MELSDYIEITETIESIEFRLKRDIGEYLLSTEKCPMTGEMLGPLRKDGIVSYLEFWLSRRTNDKVRTMMEELMRGGARDE